MDIILQTGENKSIPIDMLCSAMHIPRATYYRHLENNKSLRHAQIPSNIPINALNDREKQCVLDLLHSDDFIDKTPYDVYYALIDKGEYYCSPRTMYRILAEQGEAVERRISRVDCNASK